MGMVETLREEPTCMAKGDGALADLHSVKGTLYN